jgi:hypothetical protein
MDAHPKRSTEVRPGRVGMGDPARPVSRPCAWCGAPDDGSGSSGICAAHLEMLLAEDAR